MIKFTGKIVSSNGLSVYENGLINLNITMSDKFSGSYVVAEIGKEQKIPYTTQEGIDEKTIWQRVEAINGFNTNVINPSFEQLQNEMLNLLKDKYTEVQFEIL